VGGLLISFHVTTLEFACLARLTCAAFNIRLATHMICAGHRSGKPVRVKISTSGAGFESGKKPVCVQAALGYWLNT
jgi:hypothetical protein